MLKLVHILQQCALNCFSIGVSRVVNCLKINFIIFNINLLIKTLNYGCHSFHYHFKTFFTKVVLFEKLDLFPAWSEIHKSESYKTFVCFTANFLQRAILIQNSFVHFYIFLEIFLIAHNWIANIQLQQQPNDKNSSIMHHHERIILRMSSIPNTLWV